jgi:hypothetical protein
MSYYSPPVSLRPAGDTPPTSRIPPQEWARTEERSVAPPSIIYRTPSCSISRGGSGFPVASQTEYQPVFSPPVFSRDGSSSSITSGMSSRGAVDASQGSPIVSSPSDGHTLSSTFSQDTDSETDTLDPTISRHPRSFKAHIGDSIRPDTLSHYPKKHQQVIVDAKENYCLSLCVYHGFLPRKLTHQLGGEVFYQSCCLLNSSKFYSTSLQLLLLFF